MRHECQSQTVGYVSSSARFPVREFFWCADFDMAEILLEADVHETHETGEGAFDKLSDETQFIGR